MNKITCKFEFECSKKWAELQATDNKNIKFCSDCNHEVYLANSQYEFNQYASDGKCVAIETIEWEMLGVPEVYEHIEYSLYIPKQPIFGSKLKSIRDLLRPELSLSEAKGAFHSRSVKVENITQIYAEELKASLEILEISAEVQSKKIKVNAFDSRN
jgi:hypothetical protein